MNKLIRPILIPLLVAAAATADHHAPNRQTVRIGIFPLEPINFIDASGTAAGLIPELVRKIFPERDGWKTVFVNGSWAEGHQRLQDGEIDIMPCTTWTEERAKEMDFSKEAAFESWGQVCVRPRTGIDTWEDLKNKTVAVMAKDINGINFSKTAQMLGIKCTTIEYETHHDVFQATASGQADAGVAPQIFAGINAHNHHLIPTTILFSPSPAFFVTRKGENADLLTTIDKKLAQWKEQGSNSPYHQAVSRWLDINHSYSTQIPKWIWGTLAAVATVALLLSGANRLLKTQIQKRTRELADKQHRFELGTQAGGIGVWDLDLKKNILIWDERMREIYGIRDEDFGGAYEAWKQSVHPADLKKADAEVTAAIQDLKDFDTTFRIVRPDGAVRHIRAFASVTFDAAGEPERMVGTNQDITKLTQFNRMATGRELRMIELKKEINDLCRELERKEPYTTREHP